MASRTKILIFFEGQHPEQAQMYVSALSCISLNKEEVKCWKGSKTPGSDADFANGWLPDFGSITSWPWAFVSSSVKSGKPRLHTFRTAARINGMMNVKFLTQCLAHVQSIYDTIILNVHIVLNYGCEIWL